LKEERLAASKVLMGPEGNNNNLPEGFNKKVMDNRGKYDCFYCSSFRVGLGICGENPTSIVCFKNCFLCPRLHVAS